MGLGFARGIRVLWGKASKGLLLWLARRGLVSIDRLINVARADLGVALDLSYIVLSKRDSCPNEEFISVLRSHGLYEAVLTLHTRGCSVDREVLEEAHAFFMLAGDVGRARITSSILGISLGNVDVAVFYCGSDGKRELMAGDSIYSSTRLSSSGRSRLDLTQGWEERLYSFLKPRLVLTWGCTSDGVDAKRLARITFPDVETSIVALSYHLEEDPKYPTRVILRLAQYFRDIVERRLDWSIVPSHLSSLRELKATYVGVGRSDHKPVIVTDKPRLSYALLKPYRLNVKARNSVKLDDALLAAKILEARMGDPSRAYFYNKGRDGFGERLASIIASSLTDAGRVSIEELGVVQVEPWDRGLIFDLLDGVDSDDIEYDCTSYLIDCIQFKDGVSRYEERLLKDGIMLPGKYLEDTLDYHEDARGLFKIGDAVRAHGYTRSYLPEAVSSVTGVKSGGKPSPLRVYTRSRGIRSPEQVAGVIKEYTLNNNGITLVITPSDYISSVLAEHLQGILIKGGGDLDKWIDSGQVGVVTWSNALVYPELLSASSNVVLVFPESIVRGPAFSKRLLEGDLSGFIDLALGSLVELIAKYNGFIITRALPDESVRYVELDPVDYPYNGASAPGLAKTEYPLDMMAGEVDRLFRIHWGWGLRLRKHQERSIRVLLDAYRKRIPGVVMSIYPTGAGKSAIYQLTARWALTNGFGGYGLVISPLKALMRDQVSGSNRKGLNAARIDSSISMASRRHVLNAARMGLLDLVYITPERFEDESLESLLNESPPSLIVLDEAHTLARWGNSFRPSYLHMAKKVAEIRDREGWPPVALFTATAPRDVVREVLALLGVDDYVEASIDVDMGYAKPVVIKAPIVRREIVFDIIPAPQGDERLRALADLVDKLSRWADGIGGSWIGIVFTGFVRSEADEWANADSIASYLSRHSGIPVLVYHGQMNPASRRAVEEELYKVSSSKSGKAILVATKAFGMGVDIPNIRWIVHFYPSDSIEDLYQEVGRAGRDGREARIVIMYNPDDFSKKFRMAMRQRMKPSRVLEVLNLIAGIHESARRDKRTIILPLEAISHNSIDAVRALNMLRILGLVDYWVVRGDLRAYKTKHVDALGEYARWMWAIGRDTIISHSDIPASPLWSTSKPYIVRCSNGEVGVYAFGRELLVTGDCDRVAYRYSGGKTRIAIISINPDAKIRKSRFLEPGYLQAVIRYSTMESLKLKALKELLEEALATRMRGGPEQANNLIRERLNTYLRDGIEPLFVIDKHGKRLPDPGTVECMTLSRCLDDIVSVVSRAVDVLGSEGVVIGVRDPGIEVAVRRALVKSGLKEVRVGPRIYESVLSTSKRSLSKLMDLGYIVIIARYSGNTLNALDRLREYPYIKIYIVKS